MVESKYLVRWSFFRALTNFQKGADNSALAMAARDILSRSRLDNDSLAKIW